ncbi:Transcription factor fungi [Macrophomina phaseolina MS6]|uniref:Transcription factor fungi n=1 Tax=Macrophomina phaseolina (strain MS6) TaxID=1126212 RepID=K2RAT4_MACPH|nr:Transcription factor fungi [Macrophomina phaseolina MS6]
MSVAITNPCPSSAQTSPGRTSFEIRNCSMQSLLSQYSFLADPIPLSQLSLQLNTPRKQVIRSPRNWAMEELVCLLFRPCAYYPSGNLLVGLNAYMNCGILTNQDGQKDRSWLHLDLALWLAQHSKLTEEPAWNVPPVELEERRRCAWSLYILGRMTGSSPKLPIVTCRFPGATASLLHSPESPVSEGEIIISNNIKLYDILEKVQHFAAQSNCEAGKSLWTGDSEYGSIVSALMEYESQFPDEHRFSEHTSGNFKDDRAYWAPWFSIQFMYHAILCILNHPFLLAIRLEPIKESSPRTFKQTTADLAKLHSYWAFRFTSVAKEFGYAVTDPLIAYAVTVAATIFDHYRLSPETQARRDARDKFIKCLAFVREIGKVWPIAAQMVRPLILVAYPF